MLQVYIIPDGNNLSSVSLSTDSPGSGLNIYLSIIIWRTACRHVLVHLGFFPYVYTAHC